MSKKVPTLYHISFNPSLPKTLYPKMPEGHVDDNNPEHIKKLKKPSLYTERLPGRICFAPTLEHCYRSVYAKGKKNIAKRKGDYVFYYVYILTSCNPDSLLTPEDLHDVVWDAFNTQEHAFTEPVTIEKIGKIRVHWFPDEQMRFIHPFNNKANPEIETPPEGIKIDVIRKYTNEYPIAVNAF